MRPTIEWAGDRIIMIDQRKLPLEETYVECRTYEEAAEAIETMVIRGAPAIGVAAAMGVAIGMRAVKKGEDRDAAFARVHDRIHRTRPTARNLFWALERMKSVFEAHRGEPLASLQAKLAAEAVEIDREDEELCRRIGTHGAPLIKDGEAVLTHCNAGGLATAGYGTAVGVIRAAWEAGRKFTVFADETRPFLQGARLTAWELERIGVPYRVITDNMAGWLMHRGEISAAVVGADRIVRNGDAANKIGTYSVAVLCRENNLPFYVAAPLSTFDFSLADGSLIPIEERPAAEVREINGRLIVPPTARVRNPAFDVTPARYIAGIVTENGVARPPYEASLEALRRK
ncbi:MAG TPA: S-methyl-5-thioribose-1-phosphate isomerase [Candidatus Aminicenantes bacterium]|nr:MAG: Methylthioribose-1-phosphate isomerase [Candidatus Aminicenantes bacterium ADurb.Bin147]HNQ80330.1 S-methyl-5-thioribose-1-phosphate isomerase [Candidatus Aminicenantes bacterium]HNT31750.1 S-methyl-5-thioribose-1-phosphate isomerase [Candidatus Aminicenantes bacterium]HOY98117.1 S-methyl-5-thioribose-1-phosphate isomerase [Candidatus Aminicenantes bacterium]HPN16164.1 S-methyl-5-thioribose-1-phosphate isomerase [Candidatus Aminicenantes bacterium]